MEEVGQWNVNILLLISDSFRLNLSVNVHSYPLIVLRSKQDLGYFPIVKETSVPGKISKVLDLISPPRQNIEEIVDLHSVFVLERFGSGYLGVTTGASLGLVVKGLLQLHGFWISCRMKRCLSGLSDYR